MEEECLPNSYFQRSARAGLSVETQMPGRAPVEKSIQNKEPQQLMLVHYSSAALL